MKISANPTFETKVNFRAPGESGIMEKMSFDAQFKFLDKTAYDSLMARAKAKTAEGGDGDQLIIDTVLIGWADVQDNSGANLPYSQAALSELCTNFMAAKPAIAATWVNAQFGVEQGN